MVYDIFYENNRARLFLSQLNRIHIASILCCIKQGSWAKNEEIISGFDMKTFQDFDKQRVIEKVKSWFSKNISKEFKISPTPE